MLVNVPFLESTKTTLKRQRNSSIVNVLFITAGAKSTYPKVSLLGLFVLVYIFRIKNY